MKIERSSMTSPQTGDLFQCVSVIGVVLNVEKRLDNSCSVTAFWGGKIMHNVVLHDLSYERNVLVKRGTSC